MELEDRFLELESRVTSLEASTKKGGFFEPAEASTNNPSPPKPHATMHLESAAGRAWSPGRDASTFTLSPQKPYPTRHLEPAEASLMGHQPIIAWGGDADVPWRRELEKIQSDLMSHLSPTTVELGRMQEQLGALEQRVFALQGTTGLAFSQLANVASQDPHRRDVSEPSVISRVSRIESAMTLEFPSMRDDVRDLKDSLGSKLEIEDWKVKTRDMESSLLRAMHDGLGRALQESLGSKLEIEDWRVKNRDMENSLLRALDATSALRTDVDKLWFTIFGTDRLNRQRVLR